MIQGKIHNLVSIAIFFLYNKLLSGYKRVKMVLEMKFQKNDSGKAPLLLKCSNIIVRGFLH